MDNKPLVSIIMAVFNAEEYLNESIESVLNQSYENWELLCVNDGSTDESLFLLNKFASLDKRIHVFNQENSGTAAAARNTALEHVRGEYIQMLDSDDLLSCDCLERSLAKAALFNSDFVILDIIGFESSISNVIFKIEGFLGNRDAILDASRAFKESLTWNIGGIGLINSKLLKSFGYDTIGMNGDEYTTRLLFLNSKNITFCNGIYYYRQHTESTTKKISIRRFDTIKTDFRILELAKTNKLSNDILKICSRNIVNHLSRSVLYYIKNKNSFTLKEQIVVNGLLSESYQRIKSENVAIHRYRNVKFQLCYLLFRNRYMFKMGHILLLIIKPLKKFNTQAE